MAFRVKRCNIVNRS